MRHARPQCGVGVCAAAATLPRRRGGGVGTLHEYVRVWVSVEDVLGDVQPIGTYEAARGRDERVEAMQALVQLHQAHL
jgi:hypothetical protein